MFKCKQDVLWFECCRKNDIDKVKEMAKTNVHRHDPRMEYHGFTGLIHAAYSDARDVFQYLFQIEADDTVRYNVRIQAPGVAPETDLNIPSGASVVMVLLLRNSYECMRVYLSLKRSLSYFGAVDVPPTVQSDDGFTALHICALVSSNIGLMYFQSDINNILQDFKSKCNDDMTVLHAILLYKRHKLLHHLLTICEKNKELQQIVIFKNEEDRVNKFKYSQIVEYIKLHLALKYNNMTCKELCSAELPNKQMFRITDEDIAETIITFDEMIAVLNE